MRSRTIDAKDELTLDVPDRLDEAADCAAWNRFVERSGGGDIVQATFWGLTKRTLGFSTALAVCRDRGAIVGGALIVLKRFGPLGSIGYVARGPVLPSGAGKTDQVLDEVERVARAQGVRHLIIQPPLGGEHIEEALAARGYTDDAPEVAPSGTIMIDLRPTCEAIFAQMAAEKRRAVRLVLRHGVELKWADRSDIEAFHSLHVMSARRQGFAPLSKPYLYAQWDALRPHHAVQLFLAQHDGQYLAGNWMTAFGNTVTARVGGWNGEKTKLRPNVACDWGAIRWARENGYKFYDFCGIGGRRNVDAIRRDQMTLDDLKRTELAFKVAYGGQLVLLPRAWQRTLTPLARPLVRMGYRLLGSSSLLRSLMQRSRSG